MTSLDALTAAIEEALSANLPSTSTLAPRLTDAMRYAVLGGGKRIHPVLTCAVAEAFGAPLERALVPPPRTGPRCRFAFASSGTNALAEVRNVDDQ